MSIRFFSKPLVVLALLSVPAYGQTTSLPQVTTQTQSEPSPEVKQMQHFETSWSDAINNGDQYGLELVLSPLFVDISSAGQVTTRNQQIANLVTKTTNMQELDQKVVTVRMLGDVALVNGTYSFKTKQEGSLVEEKGIFTHVYQRTRANWLCVSSQRTPIVEESLAKKKKPEQKKSTAELPFHIPLLHKGAEKAPDSSAQQPAPQQQPSVATPQQ